MNPLWRALQFFKPDRPLTGAVLALLVSGIGLNLLKPWPLAIIVDSVLGNQPLPGWLPEDGNAMTQGGKTSILLLLAGILLLLYVGQGTVSAIQNYLAITVGLRGLRRVRNALFHCLMRLSLKFHQSSNTGDLIYRASWDTYAFQTLFQQGLISLITASLSLVLMWIVMWRLNSSLALLTAGLVPLVLLTIRAFGKRMTERGQVARDADSRVTAAVQQTIAALPLIQSDTRESLEGTRFEERTAAAQDHRLAQHGSELVYWLAISLAFGLGTVAVVWLGSHQVMAQKLTVGELLVFLAYLVQLYEPLNQLSHVGTTVTTAAAGAKRVFEILDTSREVVDRPGAVDIPLKGALQLDHVFAEYQSGQPILQDLSFSLAPGESCAIIGPSGVGKTTLLHLVPRFFDPTRGTVKLDGVDLRDMRLDALRRQVALVFQEPVLWPATLAENIAFGHPEASEIAIVAAAKAAHADAFIRKLPLQYQTVVGDGAAMLSVGEKQRISLARALIKNAPILLLDEPTSALDEASEAAVFHGLSTLIKNRTTLMVAHRLSTVMAMDKILVIEHGTVTEFGSPAALAGGNGYFARVMRGQVPLD